MRPPTRARATLNFLAIVSSSPQLCAVKINDDDDNDEQQQPNADVQASCWPTDAFARLNAVCAIGHCGNVRTAHAERTHAPKNSRAKKTAAPIARPSASDAVKSTKRRVARARARHVQKRASAASTPPPPPPPLLLTLPSPLRPPLASTRNMIPAFFDERVQHERSLNGNNLARADHRLHAHANARTRDVA